MAYTQDNRVMSIETPLGKDVLLLRGFSGVEAVSRLFRFNLDLISEQPEIDFDAIVGKRVTITLKRADDTPRFFNGFISRFSQGGRDERFTYYNAEMVPWTWFLTVTADCRIFQKMNPGEIIEKIFTDLGYKDFANHLTAGYPTREYCVQYRETDFNFVSRLMEQYGIFYYFKHERGKHTLVMADSASEYQPCPGAASVLYQRTSGAADSQDVVRAWSREQSVRPGKYALADYNFETPGNDLRVHIDSVYPQTAGNRFEIYDYPGEYPKTDEGETLVKTRMEEEETPREVIEGAGSCRGFSTGLKFDLMEHYRGDQNQSYLLTTISHSASEQGYETGSSDSAFTYNNEFRCIPAKVLFRPDRITPKPVVEGPQTAVVVGKKGEEIWVDKHGRVKVQFHWDREGKRDENSSCWMRVSQNWAGKSWGGMFIPRIGQEVIVEFLEGDPDQPIITGRVYNAEQTPPYGLPANQTQSGVKSRSSKGGSPDNFNEIRFEDKKGKEEVFLQAEKDWTINVKNDKNQTVGHDETLSVGNDRAKTVGHDETTTVGNNRTETVGKDESVTIGKNQTLTVGEDRTTAVGTDDTLTVGNNLNASAGMEMTLQAGVKLELIGPGGSITIDAGGVTIQGVLVKIN